MTPPGLQGGCCWWGALVLAALGVGFGWGATQGNAAQPGTRVFAADTGLILSYIKPGQNTAFERTMKRVAEALSNSEEFDRRRQAVGWKVYKKMEPLESGVLLYISIIAPVVPNADYWVPQILNEAFPTEVQELYEAYAGAFAHGEMLLNLTPIDLGLTVSEP